MQFLAQAGRLKFYPVGKMLAEDSTTATCGEEIDGSRMEIVRTIAGLKKAKKGCVLTIGNFDGVHIGHREILAAASQTAAERKTNLMVVTFEPHPLTVLHPQKTPAILTPLVLKKHLIAEFSVDCLLVLKTNTELLGLSPADFVEEFLVKGIQPGVVVEGENFKFGSGRTGSVYTLQKLGAEKGFEVSAIEAKEVKLSTGQTVKISSTLIREVLRSGRVADAATALGRPYRLTGKIIPGQGKGKQLGFPTANMESSRQIIPAEGVYAGFVEVADNFEKLLLAKEKIPAVFSIGRSETLGSGNPLAIEAHLLIENVGDLSGKWLAMNFMKRIREQIKFETESQLSGQIAKDCENAKRILGT